MIHKHFLSCILVEVLFYLCLAKGVLGLACNWGRVSTQPLPGDIAVKLLKDNGFDKVKLFDPDPEALKTLANSDIQVMLGIPNVHLKLLNNTEAANDWVAKNVSAHVKNGVDIRYVAVSNEAFLSSFGEEYIHDIVPVLKNIKASIDKEGLGEKVQVTIPLNADICESSSGLPSGGDFRSNAKEVAVEILEFLNETNAPVAINIYPFLSLSYDPHFPKEYAFFNGTSVIVVDGKITYTNSFDGNIDTLVAALEKHGFGSMPIIVGEVGWPTDGHVDANSGNAQRFYQGLIDRINQKKGTPRRPNDMPEVYMFGLLDENSKSILPGNFETHWGIFNYDGSIKYQLDLGNGKQLVPAKGVQYLKKQYCVLSPKANIDDPTKMKDTLNTACEGSTACTSVGNGSSCGWLDKRTKVSYAFNEYYQMHNQTTDSCNFNGLSIITDQDPSPSEGACKFDIGLDLSLSMSPKLAPGPAPESIPGSTFAPESTPAPGSTSAPGSTFAPGSPPAPTPESTAAPAPGPYGLGSRLLEPGSRNSLSVATKQSNSIVMVIMVLSLMSMIIL